MESDFTASTFISQCYKAKGDLDRMRGSTLRAMDRIEKIVMADPGHSRAIGMGVAMLADLGEKERAREWATRARLVDPDAVNLQYNLACAMSALGENELALEALEGIASKLSPGMVSWLEADTDLDPIREEPRFTSMMEAVKARFAKRLSRLVGAPGPACTHQISPARSVSTLHRRTVVRAAHQYVSERTCTMLPG